MNMVEMILWVYIKAVPWNIQDANEGVYRPVDLNNYGRDPGLCHVEHWEVCGMFHYVSEGSSDGRNDCKEWLAGNSLCCILYQNRYFPVPQLEGRSSKATLLGDFCTGEEISGDLKLFV